jgi:protein required for attachment to host cells
MFWVVVASNAGATIYRAENRADPLEGFESLDNSDYRLREQDMGSDRPGRSFDSAGEGRHAMSPQTDAKEQVAILFAKRLAARIEAGRLSGEFDLLVLVAAPKMLGRLRREISESTLPLLQHEIAQNLFHMSPAQIRDHLPDFL